MQVREKLDILAKDIQKAATQLKELERLAIDDSCFKQPNTAEKRKNFEDMLVKTYMSRLDLLGELIESGDSKLPDELRQLNNRRDQLNDGHLILMDNARYSAWHF